MFMTSHGQHVLIECSVSIKRDIEQWSFRIMPPQCDQWTALIFRSTPQISANIFNQENLLNQENLWNLMNIDLAVTSPGSPSTSANTSATITGINTQQCSRKTNSRTSLTTVPPLQLKKYPANNCKYLHTSLVLATSLVHNLTVLFMVPRNLRIYL